MDALDSFVWLRIASYIGEYSDLCALCCTCRELHNICVPLKRKFQSFHIRQMSKRFDELNVELCAYKNLLQMTS